MKFCAFILFAVTAVAGDWGLRFTWDDPNPVSTKVIGYNVYHNTKRGWERIGATASRSFTLTNGVTGYYSVTAKTAIQESPRCEPWLVKVTSEGYVVLTNGVVMTQGKYAIVDKFWTNKGAKITPVYQLIPKS